MSPPVVHLDEMQNEPLDDRVASFLDEVRSQYGRLPLPSPSAQLSQLFATGLSIEKGDRPVTAASNANGPAAQAAGLPKWTRRRDMLKQALGSMATKVAAGATGAALTLGGLGAAGALPGPVQMAAANVAEVVGVDLPAPEQPAPDPSDETTTTTTIAAPAPAEGGDTAAGDTGAPGTPTPENPVPPTAAPAMSPVPTSVSEAAHTHDFDDECGNHGHYVSHFARTGEEPQCAKDARAAQAAQPAQPSAAPAPAAQAQQAPAAGATAEDSGAGAKARGKHAKGGGQAKAQAERKAAKKGGGGKGKGRKR